MRSASLKHQVAAGMVAVMMRVQNPHQIQFMFRQNIKYRFSDAGIDNRSRAAAGFMQHINVIVAQDWNLDNLK